MNNNQKLRIMILCGDGPHHKYLVSRLSETQNVCSVVVEKHIGTFVQFVRKRKFKTSSTLVYHRFRRFISGTAGYRARFFALDRNAVLPSCITKVDDINSDAVVNCIRRMSPELIVVMGTSILKNDILSAAREVPIINIHGGCLPAYRGNHCFFFALLNEDYSNIASTIHFIDPGIDSGAVICRIHPDIYKTDNAEKLYCRAEKEAISKLEELISEYGINITKLGTPQAGCGHIYYTKDRKLSSEIKMRSVRRRMRDSKKDILAYAFVD